MNRKKRNLLLLLAATAAVGLLLWALAGADPGGVETDDAVTESDHDSHAQSGVLLNHSADELSSVTFTNAQATYTARLDRELGKIVFDELKGYPVNSNFMETVWYGSVQMIYQDIITTTDADGYKASDFGLDKPSLTVSVRLNDGSKYTFRAGKNVPGYDEDVYYLSLSGDRNIYACTLETAFFMGNSYYLSDDIFASYDSAESRKSEIAIGDITLQGSAFSGKFRMKRNGTSDISDPFYGYEYIVTEPIRWPVKVSSSSMLVYDLQYLTANDVAVLTPTKKQISSYGLAKPYLTVSFRRGGKDCVLYFSKPGKEKMYVMLKGLDIIYELDVNTLSILHELTPQGIYAINAVSASVEGLSGIKVTCGNDVTDIQVTRSKNENAMTESDLIYTYSVSVNGEEKTYAGYTRFVKQLNGSSIQKWNVKKPSGKPYASVTLTFFDSFGRKPERIDFYQYSEREYAVVRAGYPVNTVTETWLNQMLNDCKEI